MNTNGTLPGAHRVREFEIPPAHEDRQSPHQSLAAAKRNGYGWQVGLGAGAVILGVGIFLGIHSRQSAEARLQESAERAAVPSVNVASPKPGAAAQEIALPGSTRAYNDTPIFAHANGYVKNWYVDIGAKVHSGDLLAEIEVPELDQQLHQAEADLLTAQANLDLAKLTNGRWQDLLAHKVISAQEADQVKSDLGVKQALFAAAQANLHRLQELQKYERVVAPFDGVITARDTDLGALVDSGSSGQGRQLFHLAAIQKLRVYVSVPEVYVDGIPDGSSVTITQTANAGRSFDGTVVRNANAIDQTTRTLNVEVDVDNADGKILPGAYVFVHMKLAGQSGSVTIPSNALLFRMEGLRAAKVVNGAVSLTPITIGHDFGSTVEITSGLTPKDVIVLDPSDSLADGAKVAVNESARAAVK